MSILHEGQGQNNTIEWFTRPPKEISFRMHSMVKKRVKVVFM